MNLIPPGQSKVWRPMRRRWSGVVQISGNHETRMHTTDTVDYVTVMSGEVWLVLDDGDEVHLTMGECVVQNGTQHACHNRKPEPCVVATAVVGDERRG